MDETGAPLSMSFKFRENAQEINSDVKLFSRFFLSKTQLTLHNTIYEKISLAESPYSYVLHVISVSCKSRESCSLPPILLTTFKKWLCKNKPKEPLNVAIQKYAVHQFLQVKSSNWINLACEIYELHRNCQAFKEIIDFHLANGHLKEAAELIKVLHLQPYFTLEQVVVPLLFFDMKDFVQSYMEDYPEMKLQLVKKLDSALADSQALTLLIDESNLKEMKIRNLGHKCNPKFLRKMLTKLVEQFKIPLEELPNLELQKMQGQLNFLLYKRFSEQSMSNEAWKEMTIIIVKDNRELQKELLIRLISQNEIEVALDMAHTLQMSVEDWPDMLSAYARDNANYAQVEPAWDEVKGSSDVEPYLTLPLDTQNIHIIDTPEKFMDCITVIEVYEILSFDAEWRPAVASYERNRLSLIQLAVQDCVFLLDMLRLPNCLTPEHWDQFMARVFCNPKVLKLGFGIKFDILLLKQYCSGNTKNPTFVKVIDYEGFFQYITHLQPNVMSVLSNPKNKSDSSFHGLKEDKGLSGICLNVLGKALNKMEQFSDWERRPLRNVQLIYAALDAYCLLLLHERLSVLLSAINVNMEDIIKDYFSSMGKPDSASKAKVKERKLMVLDKKAEVFKERSHQHPPIPISEFKVVVDNMFYGLGKNLRIFGADVVLLSNEHNHWEGAKIAVEENRAFITTGHAFLQNAGILPDGMCFNLNSNMSTRDQLISIYDYFNVVWSENDIFTRCTVCNCNQYLEIPSGHMECLWRLQEASPCHETEDVKQEKPFIVCEGGFITENGTMHNGVKIQMDGLADTVLQTYPLFYVCTGCGKVYWIGSHHHRKKESMHTLLDPDNDSPGQTQAKKLKEKEKPLTVENQASTSKYCAELSPWKTSAKNDAPSQTDAQSEVNTKVYMVAEEDINSDDDCDDMVFNY